MRTLTVLKGKHGAELSANLLDKARTVGRSTLAIKTGYDFEEWLSPNRDCAILIWNNDPPPIGEKRAIFTDGHNAFAYSGYWYSDQFETDEELAQALFNSEDPRRIISNYVFGAYVISLYIESANSLRFFNTVSCQPVLFFNDTSELFMASTRGISIPLVLNDSRNTVEYELNSFTAFWRTGYFSNDYIAYKNVELLDSNTELEVSGDAARLSPIDTTMDELGLGEEEMTDEFLDRFCDLSTRLVKKICQADCKVEMGLSGGRDSRLVVAALSAAGVNFTAQTNGWSDSPDVVIAKKLAKILNVDHQVSISDAVSNDAIEVTPLNALREQMFLMDSLYFYPMVYPKNIPTLERRINNSGVRPKLVQFAGTGAEMLRGGVGIRSRAPLRGVDEVTPEYVEDLVRNQWLGDLDGVHPEYASSYEDWVEEWIEKYCRGKNPDGVLERLYLHNWAGRGRGAITQNLQTNTGAIVNLMTDSGLFKLAHRLKPHYRYNERLFYEVIKRLAPAIADVPLNDHRWAFELNGPRPGDEEGYEKRRPIHSQKIGRGPSRTYFATGTDLRELFESKLLHDQATQPLYDVIKREWVEQLFTTHRIYQTYTSYSTWRTLGLAELISSQWISPGPLTEKPISVRHGSRWDGIALEFCAMASDLDLHSAPDMDFDLWRSLTQSESQISEDEIDNADIPSVLPDGPLDLLRPVQEAIDSNSNEEGRPIGSFKDLEVSRPIEKNPKIILETKDHSEKGRWFALDLTKLNRYTREVFEFEFEISSSAPFGGYAYLQTVNENGKGVTLAQAAISASRTRKRFQLIGPITGGKLELWIPVLREEGETVIHSVAARSLGSFEAFVSDDSAANSDLNRLKRMLQKSLSSIEARYQIADEHFTKLLQSISLDILGNVSLSDFLTGSTISENVLREKGINTSALIESVRRGVFSHFKVDVEYWMKNRPKL